ncbi:MAG: hypothetical protein AAGD12_10410 [Pseudomonadota bacterium]
MLVFAHLAWVKEFAFLRRAGREAPALSAIVSAQAAHAGVAHRLSSFGGMLGAHLAHLRHMDTTHPALHVRIV